ncbi:MAG: hypothetical protein ACM336_02260 [Acidobacteriota bacterium]
MEDWKPMVVDYGQAEHGPDVVEYALMLGFIAVSSGALLPNVATGISIFLNRLLALVAG